MASYLIAMKYRLPFFITEITLLVLVGLSALQPFNGALFGVNTDQWLIQLSPDSGAATFLLLILMNLLLIFLYFRPEADVLWWLNLVALTALTFGVLSGFSPGHALVALSLGLALAYRRTQGLKHIWHWRGLLVVGLGVLAGLIITVFGMYSVDMWLEQL
jgi:hypothetical protein